MNIFHNTLDPNGCDFYDVDRTIIDGTTGIQSLFTAIGLGILPVRILYTLPKLLWQYNYSTFDTRTAAKYFRDLAGVKKSELVTIGEVNFSSRVRPKIFRKAAEHIAERKALGRTAVFLSSSFIHILRPLAEHLQVEHILANELLLSGDRTTGFLREPFLFGDEKKHQALAFMKARNCPPESCSFFTDSIHDHPLLEVIGEPVAVNPDRRLRKLAAERGWRIEQFKELDAVQ